MNLVESIDTYSLTKSKEMKITTHALELTIQNSVDPHIKKWYMLSG